MKLFVSGKYGDKKLIKTKMDELIKLGYEITHDWTTFENGKYDLSSAAVFDINGVKSCDVHVIVITDDKYVYRGTFTELGCALGLEKPILIFCPFEKAQCMTVPFYHHPSIKHFKIWTDLLKELCMYNIK